MSMHQLVVVCSSHQTSLSKARSYWQELLIEHELTCSGDVDQYKKQRGPVQKTTAAVNIRYSEELQHKILKNGAHTNSEDYLLVMAATGRLHTQILLYICTPWDSNRLLDVRGHVYSA